MNFGEMTIEQLKKYLDEQNVNYSDAKIKNDYIALAEQVQNEQEDVEQPTGLEGKIKSALQMERTETKKVDNTLYLGKRDYSELTVGERAMIREQSPEYENEADGVEVVVTDRLTTNHRIVRLANGHFAKLLKGATYMLAQKDYDVLKDQKVKVKTLATQRKCCGQARYEEVYLLEGKDA